MNAHFVAKIMRKYIGYTLTAVEVTDSFGVSIPMLVLEKGNKLTVVAVQSDAEGNDGGWLQPIDQSAP